MLRIAALIALSLAAPAMAQFAALELRVVPQSGAFPGSISDLGLPIHTYISELDTTPAARTRRFEVQYRLIDLDAGDGVIIAGLSAAIVNITGAASGSPGSSSVRRALISRFEAQLAGVNPPAPIDNTGAADGVFVGASGLHRPFRLVANQDNNRRENGEIMGMSINNVTPITLSPSNSGNGADPLSWYGLYSFEFIAGAEAQGSVTFIARATADSQSGNTFGYYIEGDPVPRSARPNIAAGAGVSFSAVPGVGSGAGLVLGFGVLAARRCRTRDQATQA